MEFSLPTAAFYGQRKLRDSLRFSTLDSEKQKENVIHKSPQFGGINGPSKTWRVFRSQADALECARLRKNGLMTFAFQDESGSRLFLVVHPSVFWFYDQQKESHKRCSYEIIPEHSPCKLYFDLEFDKDCNPKCNGAQMTEVFQKIVSFFLQKKWNVMVHHSQILDLDSSTSCKFSRHLVYDLPCVFRDNYHVGNFVKEICSHIKVFVAEHDLEFNGNKNASYCLITDLNEICNFCNVNVSNISDMFVVDKKGRKKLFCDEGVYTKNRHFRIFKSTKHGKNSPLVLSTENQFQVDPEELKTCPFEEAVFLHSLVTYVSHGDSLRIIESFPNVSVAGSNKLLSGDPKVIVHEIRRESIFPEVDKFICSLISPHGRVFRSCFFSASNVIVYDIIGYRFCGNIGREHRSNNIKYIVDISKFCYYQKCHDPDCRDYRSPIKDLPTELIFYLQSDCEEESISLGYFGIPKNELELLERIDTVEYNLDEPLCKNNEHDKNFPEYGISDSQMLQLPEIIGL